MARKIIIDSDVGVDDAVALTAALFDPRLDVSAITATAGKVPAEQATANVCAILAALDPPRYPRIGKASRSENVGISENQFVSGTSGLGDFSVGSAHRQHLPPSEKVMAELIRRHPGEVTVVCLGPLTNLARLCQRDPSAVTLIDKVIISGGAVGVAGDVTTVAEFNLHFDPVAGGEVFSSPTTKSLVPLDVTENIVFGLELLDQIPSKYSRAGAFLHQILPYAFRMSHQKLGRETLPLCDATAIASIVEPELFEWVEMSGKVETQGALTRGMSVFDRRLRPEWSVNMEVAMSADFDAVKGLVLRTLRYAGQES